MSPAAIKLRTAELDTSMPCTCTAGCTSTSYPNSFTECAQLLHARLRAVAEAEVAAFVNSADPQHADKDVAHKVFRRHARQRLIEGQHEDRIDTSVCQQPQSLGQEGQQLWRVLGIEELCRMRVEGDGDRPHATRPRLRCSRSQNLLMAAMHAVEVSDGGDGRAEILRHFIERTVDGYH